MDPEEIEKLFGGADSIIVDLNDDEFEATEFEEDEFGELQEVDYSEETGNGESHYANLALNMSQEDLAAIASDLCAKVEADDTARGPWKERLKSGLERMGIIEGELDDGPFPGSSSVVHPVITEACTQFWARSRTEVFPPAGPAKATVIGERTTEKVEASRRLEEFHNYDLIHQDRGYYRESSRLLWRLPMIGSAFRKTFRDPLLRRTRGVLIEPEHMIICPKAESLDTAPRFTHRYEKTPNELRKLMAMGHYRRIALADGGQSDEDEVTDARYEAIGIDPGGAMADDSEPRTIFEVYCELDLPGHEDEADGELTGIELPYMVVIDEATTEVLAIFRNWSEDDELRQREMYFTSYEFVPGFGPYGYGLFHLIGGLQDAATGALRSMLDAAAMASLSGGYYAKDASMRGDLPPIQPGVWQPAEMTSDEFNNAFMTPPVKEPSPALFQLLGYLVDAAQKFTATTEMQVGEANRNMPVGTTLALMEAGAKVSSAIHQGLHMSVAHELRIRHEIARANVGEDGYPYDVGGDPRQIMAADFDHGVSIIPVSDPNIFSNAQRIGMAQMAWQLANDAPDMFDRQEAGRRMLEAVRMPDYDALMNKPQQPMAYDPPGEIQAMLMGKPVLVTPDQPHAIYLQHHAQFLANPQFGGNPQILAQIQMPMMAVMGQHVAYAWQQGVTAAGMPSAPLDPETGQPMQQAQQMPPDMLAQIVQQISPQLAQIPGLPGAQQQQQGAQADPIKQAERAQELQHREQKHQQDLRHEQEKHQLEVRHELAEATQKVQQDQAAKQIDIDFRHATAVQDVEKQRAAAMLDRQRREDEIVTKRKSADVDMVRANRDLVHKQAERDYDRVSRAVDEYRRRQSDDDDMMAELRRRGALLEQEIREKGERAVMDTAALAAKQAQERAQQYVARETSGAG